MNKNMKKDNKGFSLVELIIVIAIMAILIGVVALQVVPYLEKSRVGKDRQLVDTVYSAFQTAIASTETIDGDIKLTINSSGANVTTDDTAGSGDDILNEMYPVLGASSVADIKTGTSEKLASADAKDSTKGNKTITCTYTFSTKQIVVEVPNTDIKSANK